MQGKIVQARECFSKCCEVRSATLGKDCEETLIIQDLFADFLIKQQEYDAARSFLLKCFDCRLKALGPHHRKTLRTQFLLAEIKLCGDDAEVCSAACWLKEMLTECVSRVTIVESLDIRYFPSIVRLLLSSHVNVGLDCAICLAYVAAFSKDCARIGKLLHQTDRNGDGTNFVPIFAVLQSNYESRVLIGLLLILLDFFELGSSFCDERDKNRFIIILDTGCAIL